MSCSAPSPPPNFFFAVAVLRYVPLHKRPTGTIFALAGGSQWRDVGRPRRDLDGPARPMGESLRYLPRPGPSFLPSLAVSRAACLAQESRPRPLVPVSTPFPQPQLGTRAFAANLARRDPATSFGSSGSRAPQRHWGRVSFVKRSKARRRRWIPTFAFQPCPPSPPRRAGVSSAPGRWHIQITPSHRSCPTLPLSSPGPSLSASLRVSTERPRRHDGHSTVEEARLLRGPVRSADRILAGDSPVSTRLRIHPFPAEERGCLLKAASSPPASCRTRALLLPLHPIPPERSPVPPCAPLGPFLTRLSLLLSFPPRIQSRALLTHPSLLSHPIHPQTPERPSRMGSSAMVPALAGPTSS